MKAQAIAFGITILILSLAKTVGPNAQGLGSTISFDNQSGEPALVKLIGPSAQSIEVPNGEKRTVNVAAGEYYLLARYGADPRRYAYSRGDPFKVEETATQYSVITITLHKVVGGNYATRPTSGEEFEKTSAGPTTELDVYLVRAAADVPRRGVTKNVDVQMYEEPGGKLHRAITSLKGNQFAVRNLTAARSTNRTEVQFETGELVEMVAPTFLAGDTGIHIKVDPKPGFTELLGLKFVDPVVLNIAQDNIVEADRVGVRALAFEGSVGHSHCFHAVSRATDEQGREGFAVGGFMKAPEAPDGSMRRVAGETLDCEVQLQGRDGRPYVSTRLEFSGRSRIVFVPAPSTK